MQVVVVRRRVTHSGRMLLESTVIEGFRSKANESAVAQFLGKKNQKSERTVHDTRVNIKFRFSKYR
jgi:hypothetical protein